MQLGTRRPTARGRIGVGDAHCRGIASLCACGWHAVNHRHRCSMLTAMPTACAQGGDAPTVSVSNAYRPRGSRPARSQLHGSRAASVLSTNSRFTQAMSAAAFSRPLTRHSKCKSPARRSRQACATCSISSSGSSRRSGLCTSAREWRARGARDGRDRRDVPGQPGSDDRGLRRPVVVRLGHEWRCLLQHAPYTGGGWTSNERPLCRGRSRRAMADQRAGGHQYRNATSYYAAIAKSSGTDGGSAATGRAQQLLERRRVPSVRRVRLAQQLLRLQAVLLRRQLRRVWAAGCQHVT